MVRIYITKWVLHRGILVADVPKPGPINYSSRSDFAHAKLPGSRFHAPIRMGTEAFETLEEALADTRVRFETHLKALKREIKYTERALTSMKEGKGPKVHDKIKRVADCKAFD